MYRIDHGFNQEDMQEMNRALLIRLLREEGVCARANLAKRSKLKQATVTNIINDFISWGLVREVGYLVGKKGRRSVGISINNDDYGVIGIQLARKHYGVGVYDLSGREIVKECIQTEPKSSSREVMDGILGIVGQQISACGERKILAIGAAVPGPYSVKRGRIELMTGYSGWPDIAIGQELEERFGVPVFLDNDANAGALAQYWYDPKRNRDEVLIYIADGQGVGAGIVNHGEILKGVLGMAGEIGHMSIDYRGARCACGNYGCLESYCSSIAFTREVNRILGPMKEFTFREAADMAKSGNPIVTEIYLKCCDYLSWGIANIVNCFNPTAIVIGDEMSHVLPGVMLDRVRREVERRVIPEIYANLTISMSAIENSMIHGAAVGAITEIFYEPGKFFYENDSEMNTL